MCLLFHIELEETLMKKLLLLLLAFALMLSGLAFAEETTGKLTRDLVILFTSDVHCGIDQ